MTPYYERDGITIYCGDCLKVMPQLEPPFDAIICDPPYGQTACAWDSVIPLEGMWINYKRLIKDNGAVVLFGSQPFTTILINTAGLDWFKYDLVWDKVLSSEWHSGNHCPLLSHESILIFSNGTCSYGGKKPMPYNPQMMIRDKPRKGIFGLNAENYGNPKARGRKPIEKTLLYRFPKSILTYSGANRKNHYHPTQKPVALMSYLIRTYTNPGELILDNAMGSGTTLVAAQNEGRQAVGIDTSEEYCRIAVDRLRQPSFFSVPTNGKVEAKAKQLTLTLDEE